MLPVRDDCVAVGETVLAIMTMLDNVSDKDGTLDTVENFESVLCTVEEAFDGDCGPRDDATTSQSPNKGWHFAPQ